jgi:hypothetical protein
MVLVPAVALCRGPSSQMLHAEMHRYSIVRIAPCCLRVSTLRRHRCEEVGSVKLPRSCWLVELSSEVEAEPLDHNRRRSICMLAPVVRGTKRVLQACRGEGTCAAIVCRRRRVVVVQEVIYMLLTAKYTRQHLRLG